MICRYYYSMSDLIGEIAKTPAYAETNNLTFKRVFSPLFDAAEGLESVESNKLLQKYVWPRFYENDIFYVDVEFEPYKEPVEPEDVINTREGRETAGRIIAWLREGQETYGETVKLYESQLSHLMDQVKASSTATGKVDTTTTGSSTNKVTASGTDSSDGTSSNTRTPNLTITDESTETSQRNDTPQITLGIEADKYASEIGKNSKKNTNSATGTETNAETSHSEGANSSTSNATASDNTSMKGTNENVVSTATDNDTVINRLDEIRKKLVSIYGAWANSFRDFIIYD